MCVSDILLIRDAADDQSFGNYSCDASQQAKRDYCVDSDGSLVYWGGISEHQELSVRQPSVIQVREGWLHDGMDGMFGLMFRLFRVSTMYAKCLSDQAKSKKRRIAT